MGTPTRTVAFAMSSLHLRIEERETWGEMEGQTRRRASCDIPLDRSVQAAFSALRRRAASRTHLRHPATSLGDLHQMTVRGLVLVLGGLPLAGSLCPAPPWRRCYGASWCVVEIATLAFCGDEVADERGPLISVAETRKKQKASCVLGTVSGVQNMTYRCLWYGRSPVRALLICRT